MGLDSRPRFPSFPAESELSSIRDDTVFRGEESGAWYGILAALQNSSATLLEQYSLGPVNFAQLYKRPADFRAHVIEVEGDVRRAHYLDAPQNDFGIDGYWQCWLFPKGDSNPIVVYALDMPPGFPSGQKMLERVHFSAAFFKRRLN